MNDTPDPLDILDRHLGDAEHRAWHLLGDDGEQAIALGHLDDLDRARRDVAAIMGEDDDSAEWMSARHGWILLDLRNEEPWIWWGHPETADDITARTPGAVAVTIVEV